MPGREELNHNAKLTRYAADDIFWSMLPLRVMALLYGVSRNSVNCVRRRMTWRRRTARYPSVNRNDAWRHRRRLY